MGWAPSCNQVSNLGIISTNYILDMRGHGAKAEQFMHDAVKELETSIQVIKAEK
jgi:hypothetical protein